MLSSPEVVNHHAEATRSALKNLEISGLPPSPEFTPGSERLSRWGEMTLFRAGWGESVTTQRIIDTLNANRVLSELQESQLKNLGFEAGYRFGPGVKIESDDVQEYQATYAAQLAAQSMAARGWDRLGGLYIGSSTMSEAAIYRTREILADWGIKVDHVQHHNLACQSPTTAIVHALQQPRLHGQQVVVVGLDTLTGNMANLEDPMPFTLFGNGGGALAFIPKQDLIYLHGHTKFEHDEAGITRAVSMRSLPSAYEWQPHPDNHMLEGALTGAYVAVTNDGLFMDLPPTGVNRAITMNGTGTFAYFVVEGKTVELIDYEMQQYLNSGHKVRYGNLKKLIGHQPSLAVIEGVNQRAEKQFKRRKIVEPPFTIEWVMDKTGFNNVSAGTSLIALEEHAHRRNLDTGAYVLYGMGIGNSVGAHVIVAL